MDQGNGGLAVADKRGKINKTCLAFHSDQGAVDLIALLSLGAAPQAGESKWVSSIAIHNQLLRSGRKVQSFLDTATTFTSRRLPDMKVIPLRSVAASSSSGFPL